MSSFPSLKELHPDKGSNLESTTSFCPECGQQVPAEILLCDNSVYIEKSCPVHGTNRALLEEDAGYHLSKRKFDKPGSIFMPETRQQRGCPYDCGLCDAHGQHTCIGLLEITSRCNMGCPICYADSGKDEYLSLETIERALDLFVESENGEAEILQISGGEPTLHPDLIRIIDLAMTRNIRYVMVNTNGIRIAEDPGLAKQLSKYRSRFEIYLQFDGFKSSTYRHFRGKDVSGIKHRAIRNLLDHRVPVTLVSTIEKGINDDEIGRIVTFGLETNGIRGINFQPVAYLGRNQSSPSRDRITLSGIIRQIEKQLSHLFKPGDIVPLPCNVERVAISYMIRDNQGRYVSIPRRIEIDNYLPAIENTFAFDLDRILGDGLKLIKDELKICDCFKLVKDLHGIFPKNYTRRSEEDKKKYIDENTFRLSITSFLDQYNFELRSMKKECVHVLTADGRRIPFSAYNMVHRI